VLVQSGFVGALAANNTLVVDAVHGSDVGAASGLCPYQTLTAAKNAASAGWTIVVNPGTYFETNLLKNGVNWKFQPGTTVGYEIKPWEGNSPVFTDAGIGAVTSNIEGDVFHYRVENRLGSYGMMFTNPATRITMSFNESDCVHYSPYATIPQNGFSSICVVSNCAYVSIKIRNIGNRLAGITSPGVDYREDSNTYGQIINRPASEMGFIWYGGEEHIEFDRMYAQDGERFQAAFWSHGRSASDTSDLYIKGNILKGLIYTDGQSTGTKIWVNVVEHLSTGISCYFPYGFEKLYVVSSKIGATSSSCFNFAGGGGQRVWLNAQKMSVDGSAGSWFTINSGTHTIWADVESFEDNIGTGGQVGIDCSATGINLFLKGQLAKNNGILLRWQSPSSKCVVEGLKFDTSGGSTAPISVSQSGLTLRNCVLVSGGSDSITASSAQTVKSYWNVANVAKNANITLSPDIGPFTSNAGVQ
jgi:hypothetical protein